ncbi:RidA family protein [Mucilaginibacter pocheonensis]|uniref:Reactive intermediate/imine deaminase n=1 Tax=Mucilaginibacter pocheonensis TaxID=398050 RepID=A0ABU1T6H9_9SPHI|nr:RidA family protein [Mucilaginibacter pocheonensis]MDR6940943.1 reactive intermediate/imine deaminase [Mucilaginibacter pocheonensis]
MKKCFFIILLCYSSVCFAQQGTQGIAFINPASVNVPKGYSQAVTIDLGKNTMLIMSGQVALNKSGNLVGKGDLAQQTQQVFTNIKSIVEDAGGSMNDVVKLNYYILDVSQVQALRNVRDKFVNISHPPASTLVQVSKLFRDDILIEIEATAIIQKK